MVAFTTNEKHVYHSFVYLVDVAKLLPGTNFVCGTFENLFVSAKNCQVAINHPYLQSVSDDRKFV